MWFSVVRTPLVLWRTDLWLCLCFVLIRIRLNKSTKYKDYKDYKHFKRCINWALYFTYFKICNVFQQVSVSSSVNELKSQNPGPLIMFLHGLLINHLCVCVWFSWMNPNPHTSHWRCKQHWLTEQLCCKLTISLRLVVPLSTVWSLSSSSTSRWRSAPSILHTAVLYAGN